MSSTLVFIFVLYLYLHGSTARPLRGSDKQTHVPQLQLSVKDVKISVVDQKLAKQEKLRAEDGESTSGDDANLMHLNAVEESQDIKGIKLKMPYSWKTLQKDTVTEVWRRAERLALESSASKAEETVNSKETTDTVEDIVVMDYAQPHRKPPIHNRGT
ncbi:hypothetical protein BUALT_Bualt05G0075000 [Buddleja alternifolia]|uniref:Uncharacterized protein n=1 Tax=Buddleja alternifolia TaxID=168488 RepID=A0AAV6XHE9_9LAMI|nr:hypothetical protein BUALT_Bualt05G0075000 [Buddleja alternifolia]